jgi:hypothetical protein
VSSSSFPFVEAATMRRITRSGTAAGLCLRPGRLGEVLAVAALLASALLPPSAGAEPPASSARHDYEDALRKSLLYFEAQRSGRLPHGQRVAWRDHSGLTDGLEQGVRCYCCCVDCFVRASAGDDAPTSPTDGALLDWISVD